LSYLSATLSRDEVAGVLGKGLRIVSVGGNLVDNANGDILNVELSFRKPSPILDR
jgi:hypothetical protein